MGNYNFTGIISSYENDPDVVFRVSKEGERNDENVKKEMQMRISGYCNPMIEGDKPHLFTDEYRIRYTSEDQIKMEDNPYKDILASREERLENAGDWSRDCTIAANKENMENGKYLIDNQSKVPDGLYEAMIEQAKNPDKKIELPQPKLQKLSLMDKIKMKFGKKSKVDEENKKKLKDYEEFKKVAQEFISKNPLAKSHFPKLINLSQDMDKIASWKADAERAFEDCCKDYAATALLSNKYKDSLNEANKYMSERMPEATQKRNEQLKENEAILHSRKIQSARDTVGIGRDIQYQTGIDRLAEKAALRAQNPQKSIRELYGDLRGITSPSKPEKPVKQTTLSPQMHDLAQGRE